FSFFSQYLSVLKGQISPYPYFLHAKKTSAGEIVLITGSTNGTGSQIALNFASLGATLVLWDMDNEGNKETGRLAQKNGHKRQEHLLKLSVYPFFIQVRKEVGDVTLLINNAGILLGEKFCDILDADFEKTLRVNFLSQVWTCKAFLPAMMISNRGRLVSTTSAAGLLGVYSILCWNLRFMYHAGKQGIKTTIICPYFINTEFAKAFQTNHLFLPVYDAEYVAHKIMDAIQKQKFYLIIPLTLHFLAFKM
uniref:Short chain dehydrogenase/reductase family 16C member 5 n=1 Tax=Buteo japonicus TaxID=224669 RepID=A0A8C0B907_9AVES